MVDMANATIRGLNTLYGVRCSTCDKPSAAQRAVHQRLLAKASRLLSRLASAPFPVSRAGALAELASTEPSPASQTQLLADSFDLLDHSGLVDPSPDLAPDARAIVSDPAKLFPQADAASLALFPGVRDSDRSEYIKLVVRQLRSGKVRLWSRIRGGGTVFGVGKKDSAKLREVWHGSKVSAAAVRPPVPPHLASPTALLDLEATTARPVHLSKRDARCLFDQLRIGEALQPYMGRPPVRVRELLSVGGLSRRELAACLADVDRASDHHLVYPASCVWPMGFSWSSYVAQSKMIRVCSSAGLRDDTMLSVDLPTPLSTDQTFALATDDVLLFSRTGRGEAEATLRCLDTAFDRCKVLRHAAKDVDYVLNGTAIGVDLHEGTALCPHSPKLATLLVALLELLRVRQASPWGLAALFGVVQWFDQLNRPLFACLHSIYAFVRADKPKTLRPLDTEHLAEVLLVLSLAPLWEADLTRSWLPGIAASDASQDFGFGVCFTPTSPAYARAVGTLATKGDIFVRLERGEEGDEPERIRKGTPHRLGLRKSAFSTVVCARAQHHAHSGTLEAGAITLLLKWLLRAPARHATRVPALVDALAVLGAATRGRSSAPTLRPEVRRIAALTLAGDFLMRYIYVPSEDNPADAPSRGIMRQVARRHDQRGHTASAASAAARRCPPCFGFRGTRAGRQMQRKRACQQDVAEQGARVDRLEQEFEGFYGHSLDEALDRFPWHHYQ